MVSRPLHLPAFFATLVLAATAAIASTAGAQEAPLRYRDPVFERVAVTRDIVYGRAVDIPSGNPVDLRLDWYEPVGDTEPARPAMVFIHGGGFVAGDKSTGRRYAEEFARRGYVAVSIGYRLNQGNLYTVGIPAAVADARQAVRWLRDQAGERRVDNERITIGGSSAGAITALFVTYTEVERERSGTSSDTVAVMDLWGGLYTYINEMTAGEPPLVIIHGTRDTVVPFQLALDLKARAEAVGIAHAFYPLEGVGHGSPEVAEHAAWTAAFFYDQLWPQGPSIATPTAADPVATPTDPRVTPSPPSPSPTRPVATATSTPDQSEPAPRALFLPWGATGRGANGGH